MLCRYLCYGNLFLPSSFQNERRTLTRNINDNHRAKFTFGLPCIDFTLAFSAYLDKRVCCNGLLSASVPHASSITCSLRYEAYATPSKDLINPSTHM